MDFNTFKPEPQQPLRALRLPRSAVHVEGVPDDLSSFDGGEALPESQGVDLPMPISEEEQAALDFEASTPEEYHEDWNDLREADRKAKTEQEARPPQDYTRHLCLLECGWYLDVPPVAEDVMSLLGAPSPKAMEQAQEVEQLLFGHLSEHSIIEWAKALQKAKVKAPVITAGYVVPNGETIPGASHRSPERQAAVDALDARLGRPKVSTMSPEEIAEHDNRLRAARAARKAKEPSPYDLTPAWSQDLESGVVGIKR